MTARLVVFDVDGTLVDSQAHILAAMDGAFAAHGQPVPERAAILAIVGLSLPQAMARLLPDRPDLTGGLVAAYKDSFADLRAAGDARALSPLYPGAAAALTAAASRPGTILGLATGKSRRGLDHLMDLHGWRGMFATVQVSDHHPSKPHPAMLLAGLAETGVDAARSVMVGDTTYDMDMARAAGVAGLGVGWGYHGAQALHAAQARAVLDRFDALAGALDALWGDAA